MLGDRDIMGGSFEVAASKDKYGLTEAERKAALFAWRASGDTPRVRTQGSYDGSSPSSGQDAKQVLDASLAEALLCEQEGVNIAPSWDDTKKALRFTKSTGEHLIAIGGRDYWNPFVTAQFEMTWVMEQAATGGEYVFCINRTSNAGIYAVHRTGEWVFECRNSAGSVLWSVVHSFTLATQKYEMCLTGDGSKIELYIDDMTTAAASDTSVSKSSGLSEQDFTLGGDPGNSTRYADMWLYGLTLFPSYADESIRKGRIDWINNA